MKTATFGRVLSGMLTFALASPCAADIEPYLALTKDLAQTAKVRGPGKKLPLAKDGTVRVNYAEPWLGLSQKAAATYEQAPRAKTIARISVHIPPGTTRTALLRALRENMSLPADRAVYGRGSVSATWISCGVRHRLVWNVVARDVVLEPAKLKAGAAGLAQGIVLQDALAGVTGTRWRDRIYLVGTPFEAGSIWMKSLYIVTSDPAGRNARANALGFGGMACSEMMIRDFTGDRRKDILITAPTGGSGGLSQYALLSLRGGILRPLADSRVLSGGPAISVRFNDGFKAKVTCAQLRRAWTLSVRNHSKEYVRTGVYNAGGKLLKPTTGAVDGVGLLSVRGTGSRPVLVAKRRIWGTYHANALGEATVRWRWSRGKLRIIRVSVASLKP